MSDTWYYADRRGRVGPFSLAELKARLAGVPNPAELYVWRAGFADWKRAGEVAELDADGSQAFAFAHPDAAASTQPDILQLWFSFKGRINRAKLWLVGAINLVIVIIGATIAYAMGSTVVWALFGLFYIVVIVSGLAITIKRLHDRDKSGWWALLFYVAPALLSAIGAALGSSLGLGAAVFSVASLAISIWAFVELGCLRGTEGPNQFGPDPLAGRP